MMTIPPSEEEMSDRVARALEEAKRAQELSIKLFKELGAIRREIDANKMKGPKI